MGARGDEEAAHDEEAVDRETAAGDLAVGEPLDRLERFAARAQRVGVRADDEDGERKPHEIEIIGAAFPVAHCFLGRSGGTLRTC